MNRLTALLEKKQARAGLIDFACYIDKAAQQWYRAAHLRTIASVLERVERGELKRVIVSVPPRHWKSSLASEKFPAWYLGRNPDKAIILASYALSLAEKFSRSVRDTITSNNRYKQLFDIRLKRDSNRADDWSLTTAVRSSVRAVGVGGGITGHGANIIIIDDPIADYEAAQSQTQRDNLWEWYRQVLRTRLEPGGAIVLIQTRWHEDDLAGRLLKAEREEGGENWHSINLPAQDTGGRWLWLERYSEEEYGSIRAAVGDYAWNALYQGEPTPQKGNKIKRDWFSYIPALPEGVREQVRAHDLAVTIKQTQKHDPDFTAELGASRHNDFMYLVNPRLYRAEVPEIMTNIMSYKMACPWVRLGMGKALHEKAVAQSLIAAGFPVDVYKEKGDILERLTTFINLAETGRVILVGTKEQWEPFMAQWIGIPSGAHDDAGAVAAGVTALLNFMPTRTEPKPKVKGPYEFVDKM